MIKQAYSLTREERPEAPLDPADRLRGGRGRDRADRHPVRLAVPLPAARDDHRSAWPRWSSSAGGRRARPTGRSRASPARPRGCSRACAATGGSPPASPAPPQLDAVHRVLGRPGRDPRRRGRAQRGSAACSPQEKKKVARVVGDTPIYDIIVGDDEGQIPLRKLSSHVMKLPRNLTAGRGQRPRPADERPGRRPHAGARRPAARRQADVGQPAPGPPPLADDRPHEPV